MTLMPALLALGVLAGPAEAKKKKKNSDAGVRLKYSTDVVDVSVDKYEYDGKEIDDAESRITTLSLLDNDHRFEGTVFVGSGVEVGGIISASQSRGTIGDNEAPTQRHGAVYLTGAYNMGVGNGMRFFVQPLAGVDQTTVDPGEDTEAKARYLVGGANVGLRLKINKKTSFDVAAEALKGVGKYTFNGESDEKEKYKHTEGGLRIGLSVRL